MTKIIREMSLADYLGNIDLQFGLQSDLFWNRLGDDEVGAAAGHGFSFFEIWGHLPWFDIYSRHMAREVRQVVENHGMRVRSFHAPCEDEWDISSEDDGIRRKSVHEVVLSIENCRDLGGEIVVVHAGRAISSENPASGDKHDRRLKKSIASLREIQKVTFDNGVLLAIENLTAKEVSGSEKHFLYLLDSLDHHVVGVCFDSSHANITPGTFEMFRRFRHRIITTHLSDNHGEYDEHKPPFTASVDWSMVLSLLLDNGYRGPWLLEVTNGGHEPFEILAKMKTSMETMRPLIREITARHSRNQTEPVGRDESHPYRVS